MNNQNYYGQAPQMPQMPQMPPEKPPVMNNERLGIFSCCCGLVSFGLGIITPVMANSVYGSQTISSTATSKGFSPIAAFIINILAILLGALGFILAIKAGNDRIRTGAPRGTVATLGLIFGISGFCLCATAIFFTGCNMIVNCDWVSKTNTITRLL